MMMLERRRMSFDTTGVGQIKLRDKSLMQAQLVSPCLHPPSHNLTEVHYARTSRCLRPNHPLELPPRHVLYSPPQNFHRDILTGSDSLENCPCVGLRKYRRAQIRRTNPPVGTCSLHPHRKGRIPAWCRERPLRFRKDDRRGARPTPRCR